MVVDIAVAVVAAMVLGCCHGCGLVGYWGGNHGCGHGGSRRCFHGAGI
jgi:hypothetical protein